MQIILLYNQFVQYVTVAVVTVRIVHGTASWESIYDKVVVARIRQVAKDVVFASLVHRNCG